jgi:6-pyruvoyltetrahydropterin/6-carboxytetrahydropterin synthase
MQTAARTDQQTFFVASAGFEAARQVGLLPAGHRARQLHGHSFQASLRCALPKGWAAFAGAEVAQVSRQLQAQTQRLDYQLLNNHLEQPTDENLARWLRQNLDLPGIEKVAVQSTARQGVDLDAAGQAHVWRRYVFQAAHRLPNVRLGHQCGRMHGHGFEVIVHANKDLGAEAASPGGLASAISIDYDHLDAIWAPLHHELNFGCLNDLPGLQNPTSELLASWLWQRIKPVLPELSWITVFETGSCGADFDGQRYRIWKELTLDSAVQFQHAPAGHPLRRIHGHTFTLRLHLAAPLDEVMGWTVDFGDVKELFAPIFKRLDHQPLYELPGLRDCDSASLAHWILDQARAQLPQLDRVDVFETRGCGATVVAGPEGPALPV